MTRLDRIYIENYKSAIINCPKIFVALQKAEIAKDCNKKQKSALYL